MSDRIAVFNDGRIEQVGTPAEVYERPATAFVAGFVGTSNLLRGDVARAIVGTRRDVHGPAREDPAGRARRRGRGADECAADGRIREVVYLGVGHPLHRRRSTRAPSSSSPSRTWPPRRWRRWPREGGPVRLIWKRQHNRRRSTAPSSGGGAMKHRTDRLHEHSVRPARGACGGGRGHWRSPHGRGHRSGGGGASVPAASVGRAPTGRPS